MLPSPFTPHFLTQLETLRLRTRKEFLGSHPGSYSSPRRGTSLEFADYRRYALGDDLRYLDWGIYARSDKLYVKLFREEVDLFAYVFIDASASMGYPSRELKYLPATHVGLALSYVILANHATLAGHVSVGDYAILGGLSAVQQFARIGQHAMIGGMSKAVQDVPPYIIADGNPAIARSINKVGLERHGFTADRLEAIKHAFRIFYRAGLNRSQAFEAMQAHALHDSPDFQHFLKFVRGSERGVVAGR